MLNVDTTEVNVVACWSTRLQIMYFGCKNGDGSWADPARLTKEVLLSFCNGAGWDKAFHKHMQI